VDPHRLRFVRSPRRGSSPEVAPRGPGGPRRLLSALGGQRELAVGTLGTLALNTAWFTANFVIVLLLTHLLGAKAFGAYASAIAWSTILAVVAVLGLAPLVVRHVASYSRTESWALLRGLLRWTNQAVAISSFLTVVTAVVL